MKESACLKLLSTFYSFLFLAGVATAGLGIWAQINRQESNVVTAVGDSTLSAVLSAGAPALIAVGCVLTVMGVIGCVGTLKKKSWMLLVFFIIVLIIFILQVIASVYLLLPDSVKEKSLSSLGPKFIESLQANYDQSETNIWDQAMIKMRCCGYKGYQDFTDSDFVKKNNFYPRQCCGVYSKTDKKCTTQDAAKEKVRGCIHVLLDENIPISAPLSFLIGILEIVALFVSLKIYLFLRSLPDLQNPMSSS